MEKGDPVSSILCVKSGALAVWEGATVSAARAVEGGSKTATLGAGGCFGERAALCGEPSSVTVVAEGHTEATARGRTGSQGARGVSGERRAPSANMCSGLGSSMLLAQGISSQRSL